MEVFNELENKYYIIKYDWAIYRYGFVLYSKCNLNQIEFEFICSVPTDYLFKKLLEGWEIMSEPERSKYLTVTKIIYKWKDV